VRVMAKKESMLSFRLKRFGSFIVKLFRVWQGTLGVLLISAFVFLAFFPFLFTPYNALGQDPAKPYRYLAGDRAAPSWLRIIPTFLGGIPTLSENSDFFQDPSLPRLTTWDPSGEWTFEGDQFFTCEPSDLNYPVAKTPKWFKYPPQNGSIAITYSRNASQFPNQIYVATLYAQYEYPFSGPPRRWIGNIAVNVNGTLTSFGTLEVPVLVRVFIQAENGTRYTMWYSQMIFGGFNVPQYLQTPTTKVLNNFGGWLIPQDTWESSISWMDSNSQQAREYEPKFALPRDPVRDTFKNNPGTYLYGAEIYVKDTQTPSSDVSVTVYIDNFSFDTLGTSWGILGTDQYGRDIFSQLVHGTRVSLYVGTTVALLSITIGLLIGLGSGYIGGAVDQLSMRINDLLLVLPGLPFLIVLVAIFGARLENLILFMGFLGWNGFARLVRSQTLTLKERPFVEAAKAAGASKPHIIVAHILPNVMALVYISLATSVPGAVTAEAALSWLGFYDPLRMSWGRMLNEATESGALNAWWWIIPPGLLISILAVAFILLGFALDDVLNPKLRVRR